MPQWRECKLGDLLEIKHGYAFLGKHFANGGSHIVLTPGSFYDEGGFRDKAEKEKWYNGSIPPDYVLDAGDIIVAMTEQAEGLLGSSAIIPRSGVYLHNQRLGLVRLRDETKTDKRFVYYLFNTKSVRQQIRASASGVKIRHTAPTRISEVRVRVPSFPTQRRIASVLSSYDDLIENNTRRIKILEQMAQMLHREWFVNLCFAGHEKVRMVDSELGQIPGGWTVSTLGEVAGVNELSIKYDAPEEISYIDIASVSTGSVDSVATLPFSTAPSRARRVVREGDTIWSTVRPNRKSFALILCPEKNLVVSTGFAVLSPRTIPYSYLYFATTTDEFVNYLTNHTTGSAYPAVNPKDFEAAKILIPPKVLLDKFHNTAAPMLQLRHVLRMRNACLRTTRDFLLPSLVSGEVSVEEIEREGAAQTV